MVIFPHICVQANPEIQYKTFWFKGSKIHYIETNATRISVAFTLKGYNSGINCSYFNLNTFKTVPVGVYNRPFILLKKDGTVKISDEKTDLVEYNQVASGGSWLVKNGVPYTTSDHFGKAFRNAVVRRTCVGIDKDGKIYLVVIPKANFNKATRVMQALHCEFAINMDGGTSSTLKHNGKMIITGRRVANYLVVN